MEDGVFAVNFMFCDACEECGTHNVILNARDPPLNKATFHSGKRSSTEYVFDEERVPCLHEMAEADLP